MCPDRPSPLPPALGRDLLCERLTDPEIAERLFIGRRTVSSHLTHMYDKLGVNSRREAAALAAREGLV